MVITKALPMSYAFLPRLENFGCIVEAEPAILTPAIGDLKSQSETISGAPDTVKSTLESPSQIVCSKRINDINGINQFFCKINSRLCHHGEFSGYAETLEQRRRRLIRKYPLGLNYGYYLADFIFKRIFPKFKLTKRWYLYLSKGRNRALSKSEILGRLVYCGFLIKEVSTVDNLLHFKATKISAPLQEPEPSSGVILKIKRVGSKGKIIYVYKVRTMHPYAQYLQEYVFKAGKLQEGGKFANDFRITKWGRWMRKFWIDEIPMIYNLLRGDLKLVGVRPLSEHYLNLYTPEHKSLRIQGKPGLIPPFYADMPKNIEEIMASESRYIQAYEEDPLSTDFQYCMKAFNNILINRARSH